MKRLQGAEYHKLKHRLIPMEYTVTKSGNICVYYKDGYKQYKHYLNDEEKAKFNPNGLKVRQFKENKE